MLKVWEEVVVKMVNQNHEVLVKAKELAEVLIHSKKEKDPIEFLSLLLECNSIILSTTKIDYGTTCSQPQGGPC